LRSTTPRQPKNGNDSSIPGTAILSTGFDVKTERVQVLLTVIGKEACEVFATFTWDVVDDDSKIEAVLTTQV
jgi:hypothetical protein